MRFKALSCVALLALIVPAVNSQQNIKEIKEWIYLDAQEPVTTIAVSSSGRMIALATENFMGGRIRVWSLPDKSVKCTINARSDSRVRMRFVNDDKELITPAFYEEGDERGLSVTRWDVGTGKLRDEKRFAGGVGGLSDDGRVLLTFPTYPTKIAHVWDLITTKKITLESDSPFGMTACICPQNKTIVTLHPYETRIWDYPSGKLRHQIERKGSRIWTLDPFKLSFTADGKMFHLCYPSRIITIWDPFTGKRKGEPPWFIEIIGATRILLLPDGRHLLANNYKSGQKRHDGDLFIFDIEKRIPVLRLVGTDRVMNLADLVVSADGKVVAQSTSNGTISIWQLPKLEAAASSKP